MSEVRQWRKAPQHFGKPDPKGVRQAGGNRRLTRKNSTMAGTGNGPRLLLVYDSMSS